MEYSEKVIELLNKSYSPFHVVDNLKGCLEEKGFKELKEDTPFSLKEEGRYYVTRNGSALIAFEVPSS